MEEIKAQGQGGTWLDLMAETSIWHYGTLAPLKELCSVHIIPRVCWIQE